MNRTDLEQLEERTRKDMMTAAKNLDFIEAAQLRDELVKIQEKMGSIKK